MWLGFGTVTVSHQVSTKDTLLESLEKETETSLSRPTLQTQDTETDGLMREAAEATRRRWLQLYPNDPFFLDHNIPLKEEAQTEELLGGFDLVGSTERQGAFLWQVSGERFDDVDFLREAVDNYHKFLLLRPKANGTILVPTYQIDLMWHTHILSSLRKYTKDCRAITGSALHHDDSLTDRSEGGVLDVSFRATKALWRKEFGEEYVVDGGMYRGEPPEEYNRRDWDSREIWVATIEHDLDLVGKVGASSTGVSAPTEWAVVGGKTSTGEDAFLPTTTNYPELKCLPRRKGYVLGKASSGEIGYYHIETKEAHEIVIPRLEKSVKKLELALNWEKCVPCCFDRKSFPDRERKLEETKDAMEVMKARHEAPRPSGELPKGSKNVSSYIDHSGSWLYPQAIWVGGGGACGGGVACDGGGVGGSACGGGGGCGGGGCGGGGCGGGC